VKKSILGRDQHKGKDSVAHGDEHTLSRSQNREVIPWNIGGHERVEGLRMTSPQLPGDVKPKAGENTQPKTLLVPLWKGAAVHLQLVKAVSEGFGGSSVSSSCAMRVTMISRNRTRDSTC